MSLGEIGFLSDIVDEPMSLPGIIWYGHFDEYHGYATEAKEFVLALAQNQVPVQPALLRLDITQTHGSDNQEIREKLYKEFLSMFEREPHLTPTESAISVSHGIPPHVFHNATAKLNAVRCMFETEQFPESWVEAFNKMDEMWVPSEFNLHSLETAGVPRSKLFKLPGTIDLDFFSPEGQQYQLHGGKRFKFFSSFEWTLRKGWDTLIEAFLEEFDKDEPVALLMKITKTRKLLYDPTCGDWIVSEKSPQTELENKIKSIGKSGPPIHLMDLICETNVMPSIYRSVHSFVLPSHGEGWGRPYMEAMATGLPTVGTGWSGNTEFMTRENSYLLDYELETCGEAAAEELPIFRGQRWAVPDKEQLRFYMRQIFEEYDKAKEVGARAREHLKQHFSHEVIAKLLKSKLAQFV